MKVIKKLIVAGLLALVTTAYAGNGDLIVDGKMGVGTAAPSEYLHIMGNGSDRGIRIDSGFPSFGNGRIISATSGFGLNIMQNVDRFGNLDDTSKTGQALNMGFGFGGFNFWGYSAGANPRTARSLMTILDSGKVGIGTTNPTTAIDVLGNANNDV